MATIKTVKELKEVLSKFDDACEVMINIGGTPVPIEDYAWSAPDESDTSTRVSWEESAKNAKTMYLESNCTPEAAN